MSRVLRRPMFRGGDTGGGITTGLGRQGLKMVETFKKYNHNLL